MKHFIFLFILFVSLVSAQVKLPENVSAFEDSSNVWYRARNDWVSVYSKNKRLSSFLNKLTLKVFNRITNEFLDYVPENFEAEIFVHRDIGDLASFLKCDPVEHKLKRWQKDPTLMSYQLDNKNRFRRALVYDDIPFMITLAFLNAADPDGKIPIALKIGLAHSMEQSVTNIIKKSISQNDSFWVPQETFFEFEPYEQDEEIYLNKISGTSAAWALFIKNNCSDTELKTALADVIGGKDISAALGKTLELGKYDILPRLEEKIKNWIISDFLPEGKKLQSHGIELKPVVSVALPSLAVIFLIFAFLSWIKRSIL